MKKFAGAYKGNRCFLVGNGPSLNETPLDKLVHEYTFGMNQINLLYEQTIWRPTFYLATTVKGYHLSETWRNNMLINIKQHGLTSFVGQSIPVRGANVYPMNIVGQVETIDGMPVRIFSKDCDFQVGHLGTTMYVAFQLAAWMGFNPIILLGCDLGYTAENGESRGHFTDDYWGDRGEIQPMNDGICEEINAVTLLAHTMVKPYMEAHNIDVYNATVGGELEVWPRIDSWEALRGHWDNRREDRRVRTLQEEGG
jgi:hypothetical protein